MTATTLWREGGDSIGMDGRRVSGGGQVEARLLAVKRYTGLPCAGQGGLPSLPPLSSFNVVRDDRDALVAVGVVLWVAARTWDVHPWSASSHFQPPPPLGGPISNFG
ncbi:hypothetical protein E2562_018623 [Oryza meyeriana var. granulata]|uniref:Uncharacterized protein n=1 Tax=Oryza meyeriana var. granulata TaxID=110450 RepID=A0A6G1BY00_9ORYZ|nr:hypothetical protein E2562_018623 [Oryza meyeriana var. granulata]